MIIVTFYWYTIKPGTPEHGTPAEQWNTPEQWRNSVTPHTPGRQRNTSGTPRNNGAIQNEEQLW